MNLDPKFIDPMTGCSFHGQHIFEGNQVIHCNAAKIVRYRRSDIERITMDNLIPLKDMLAQKRANRIERINRVGNKE